MTTANKPSQRNKNRAANQAAISQISELYPRTFDREAVKPLKIGIQDDLVADGKLPQGKIKRALASYVRSPLYYKALQAGAVRIDLNGEAAGEVTEEQAEHARAMLEKIREEKKARAQAAREQAKAEREKAKEARFNDKLSQLLSKNS
ncbi:ProQ/FINO family protein [Motiliproteus sp. SC1-56]|uniref:ProQ/FINO family protein n=1 Tax=Motiliproteus sp. SC1-56 TaxID=2799565 RepID=UPI001A8FBA89|nr:ProQ/FINO family protein [Motiliproteus sp. SC1-56]